MCVVCLCVSAHNPLNEILLPWMFAHTQRQYVQLQELYQQLKAQKISELEGLLEEQVCVCCVLSCTSVCVCVCVCVELRFCLCV